MINIKYKECLESFELVQKALAKWEHEFSSEYVDEVPNKYKLLQNLKFQENLNDRLTVLVRNVNKYLIEDNIYD